MSISRPDNTRATQRMPSPVEEYISWDGKNKQFKGRITGNDEEISYPRLSMIVLDNSVKSLGGWNEVKQERVFSNRVTDIRNQRFTIWNDKGQKVYPSDKFGGDGNYTDKDEKQIIKDIIKARYEIHLFCYVPDTGRLVDFTATGSSLSPIIEIQNEHGRGGAKDLGGMALHYLGEVIPKKKGNNSYNEPVFKVATMKSDHEYMVQAIEKDEILQPWIDVDARGKAPGENEPPEQPNDSVPIEDIQEPAGEPTGEPAEGDELPF
jgi:hypothetical protein